MKKIAELFRRGALGIALGIFVASSPSLPGQTPDTSAGKPAAPEELSQAELLKSYLQMREQLHATQLAIANNRVEAEATARAQAAAITEKLDALRTTMDAERERHRLETEQLNAERERQRAENARANAERDRQQAELERSNRAILWIAIAFGGVGLLAVIVMPLFQWRALHRITQLQTLPARLPAPAGAGMLQSETEKADQVVALSNQRLLSVIDRMEQRIFELEHTTAHPLPSSSANPFTAGDASRRPIALSDQMARINLLMSRGRTALDANRAREALTCFDEILKLDFNHPEALVRRGSALERLKQDDEAIQCYDRAIKIDPRMTLAYLHKGGVCNRLQRYEEALKCYEQALRVEEEEKQSGGSRSPVPGPWPTPGRSLSAS
jgi:tetratricopeptide (TPR) repeat protein